MPNAENAVIYLEQGASLVDFAAMTDSGDQRTYTAADDIYSGRSGQAAEVRPNGIVSGRNLISPHADSDKVAHAAFTAYSQGVLKTVAAGSVSVTRGVGDGFIVNSIVMASDGTVSAVDGTEGAAFSETRGAAGGPPLIDADAVELGQVRLSSTVSAAVAADEILQVVGQHAERFDHPAWEVDPIGQGLAAAVAARQGAHVQFVSALPAIHADSTPKKVYIRYYTPIFAELAKGVDFVPAETSHSVQSRQVYRRTLASTTSSLGQASFTALLDDAVTDALVAEKDEVLTVKFLPDENRSPYLLTQGKIGISRSFPVGDQISAAVTVSSEKPSAEFAG